MLFSLFFSLVNLNAPARFLEFFRAGYIKLK